MLVCAVYNSSDTFDAVRFVKNTLQRKFAGLDVEFFFDLKGWTLLNNGVRNLKHPS